MDFSSGEYGSQTREKSAAKSDTEFNKTAWTSYLKSLIKYHEKQVKKSGGKIPDVTPQNQQRYLLKMAVKLQLDIDLNADQITEAFKKNYKDDKAFDVHRIVDLIISKTSTSTSDKPGDGVGGGAFGGLPTPPTRTTGTSAIHSGSTSGNIDGPLPTRLSVPNSKPVQTKHSQLMDLQNQFRDVRSRFEFENPMMDGSQRRKVFNYFYQLHRVMQRLLRPDEEPLYAEGSPEYESEELIQTLANVAEKAFKVNGFYPRANQLLSVLMFAQGKDSNALGQIRTGQGKTLIAAMTAIVRQQVYKQDVVIISTTEPLAEDGANDQKALYDAFGVPVSYFSDKENKVGTKAIKSPRVIYATSFSLESDKLRQEKVKGYRKGRRPQDPKLDIWPKDTESKPNVCFVVDECDSVLYDHADSVIRSSGPLPFAEEIQAIATHIAKEVMGSPKSKEQIKTEIEGALSSDPSDQVLQVYVKSHLDAWIDDAMAVFNKHSNFRDGVNYVKSSSIGSFIESLYDPLTRSIESALETNPVKKSEFMIKAEQLKNLLIKQENEKSVLNSESKLSDVNKSFEDFLKFIFQQLNSKVFVPDEPLRRLFLKVNGIYKEINQKFKEQGSANFTLANMYSDNVYYVDEATGQIIPKMRFDGLKHLFMEFKEYGKINLKPSTALDYQSQLGLLLDGQCMVGFTGSLPDATLDPLNHLEFKSILNVMYGSDVPCAMIPDFKPRERIDLPPIQCIGEVDDKARWETEVKNNIELYSSAQPILLVCETIEEAEAFKTSLSDGPYTIKMYTDKSHAVVAAEPHGAKTIVITTRLGSRGTDWRVADECKASGLHVICTFPPGDARQRAQIQGRAGRSGSPGSTIEITYKRPPENNVKSKDGLVRAIMDELFSQMFYQLEQSVKDVKQGDLKLWFSIDVVRNKLTKEVKDAIKSRKNQDEVVEIIKKRFYNLRMTPGSYLKIGLRLMNLTTQLTMQRLKFKPA